MAWSTEEKLRAVQMKAEGFTNRSIAEELGKEKNSVQVWFRRNGVNRKTALSWAGEINKHGPKGPPVPETTLDEDKERFGSTYWKTEHKKLMSKYLQVIKGQTAQMELVNRVLEVAPVSYDPAPKLNLEPVDLESTTPQSLMLMLSDSHMGKVVSQEHTMGFGEYNFSVFLDRLSYLQRKVLAIRAGHIPTPINELVITMLGDMHHGMLKKGSEAELPNIVFNTFYQGGHALAQFFRSMCSAFAKVRVICVTGNHGRWDTQRKMPSENRHSNFDGFLYAYVDALLRDLDNIKFQFTQEPFQVFDTQGFRFHASHGEHLRGGDKMLGIPAHAIGRNIANTSQLYAKAHQPVPNYYLCGHVHREITLPHALGSFMFNGSFVGVDGYGTYAGFTPAEPSQRLFCVHPKYGKTSEWSVSMQFATEGEGCETYSLPEDFPVL